jgi:hypothetical protein
MLQKCPISFVISVVNSSVLVVQRRDATETQEIITSLYQKMEKIFINFFPKIVTLCIPLAKSVW